MDKFELIERMIVELNGLTVQGVNNMSIVVRTIQNLSMLSDGLKEEIEKYRNRILELEKQVSADENASATAE